MIMVSELTHHPTSCPGMRNTTSSQLVKAPLPLTPPPKPPSPPPPNIEQPASSKAKQKVLHHMKVDVIIK
jgi:hypothetical protein